MWVRLETTCLLKSYVVVFVVSDEEHMTVLSPQVQRLLEAKKRLDTTHKRIEGFKTRNNETVKRLMKVRREANEASRRAKKMLKVLDAINSVPSDAELEFQREIKKMSVETSQRLAPRVNLLKTQSRLVRDALKARGEDCEILVSADQRAFCDETLQEMKDMLDSIRGVLHN